MELGLDKEKLKEYRDAALKHLGNPAKLRLFVVLGLLFVAFVGVYMPFTGKMSAARAALREKRQRLEAIKDVQALRKEAASFRSRIAKHADTNDWVQYVLGGLRKVRVNLRDMASKPPKRVGPYCTVTLTIEVEGTYAEVKEFMEWLEQSERLLRVDSTQLEKQQDRLVMKLTLLGLVHKDAGPS
ncbi:MAG: hypothetical protein ACYS8K_11025 [Planctomycetota bacterium]|jgi:Tfp pilus assembly protein PilO